MDASLVGRTGEPFRMVVEEGKVREFARATKSSHPDHHGEQPVTPVTFLMSAAFWQTSASSAFAGVERNWARILHGEQHFTFHGPPPRAGDVLVGQQRIDKVYDKEGRRGGTMQFAEAVTEFRREDGELVAEVRLVTIETSKPAGEDD